MNLFTAASFGSDKPALAGVVCGSSPAGNVAVNVEQSRARTMVLVFMAGGRE